MVTAHRARGVPLALAVMASVIAGCGGPATGTVEISWIAAAGIPKVTSPTSEKVSLTAVPHTYNVYVGSSGFSRISVLQGDYAVTVESGVSRTLCRPLVSKVDVTAGKTASVVVTCLLAP